MIHFIFPTFTFKGDQVETSAEIQSYCSQWYEHGSTSFTFINVVYYADLSDIYAPPNIRVYKVTREEGGFSLAVVKDFLEGVVAGSKIAPLIPWDTIYGEAYYWEWVDRVSYSPTYFPTVNNTMPKPEEGKIPVLTPNGYVNMPYSSILPPDDFNCGGMAPDGYRYNYRPAGGWGGWSFLGFDYRSASWSSDKSTPDELFPNFSASRDVGRWVGMGEVVGGESFGRYSTAQMFFPQYPFRPRHPGFSLFEIHSVDDDDWPPTAPDSIGLVVNFDYRYPTSIAHLAQLWSVGLMITRRFFANPFTAQPSTVEYYSQYEKYSFDLSNPKIGTDVDPNSVHPLEYANMDTTPQRPGGDWQFFQFYWYRLVRKLEEFVPLELTIWPEDAPNHPLLPLPIIMLPGFLPGDTSAMLCAALQAQAGSAGRRDKRRERR